MTLEDMANFAQVIGAATVVASLVFLAIEVRQAGREMLASTQQAQANAHAEYLLALASQPLLSEMLDRSVKTIPSMTAETAREGLFHERRLHPVRGVVRGAQSLKTRGAGGSRHIERALGRWASWPRVRDWWARDRDVFADDFQALVDEKIARAQAPNGPEATTRRLAVDSASVRARDVSSLPSAPATVASQGQGPC